MWDGRDGRELTSLMPFGPDTGLKRQIRSLAFDPSGTILVAGTSEGTVLVFDTTQRVLATEPLANHGTRNVDTVAFSLDGTLLGVRRLGRPGHAP